MRAPETKSASPQFLLSLLCLLVVAACAGREADAPIGADPDRMSESEYDIAKDLWLRQNQPREALAHCLRAVELDDHNAEAHHLSALLYLDLCGRSEDDCRLDSAERHVREAISVKEDYREAVNTLGVVLIHRKKYDDAIVSLKPLTADILYQTPENAWGNLGWAYYKKGAYRRAIDALQRSVAAQPRFCVGNYRLGMAHEKNHQPREALAAYTRALETDEPVCRRLQEGYLSRARVHLERGTMAEAQVDLDRCIALEDSSAAGKDCRTMLSKLK
jgi:Tfp pilus assembly protein PilF